MVSLFSGWMGQASLVLWGHYFWNLLVATIFWPYFLGEEVTLLSEVVTFGICMVYNEYIVS